MARSLDMLRGEVVEAAIRGNNFWGIAKVKDRTGKTHVVTGSMLSISPGETVVCRGSWEDHARFGMQFRAREIEIVQPTEASGVIGWLALRLPNVGRARAERLVAHFGIPGIWDVLELEAARAAEKLTEVEGITPTRAVELVRAYADHRAERDRMVLLTGWGLTQSQVAALVAAWGDEAVTRLRADPYAAIEEVRGFGFKRADGVATRMGLEHDAPQRVRAGVMHVLREARERGHTYVPAPKLIKMASKLLDVADESVVARELYALRDTTRVVGGGGRARLPELHGAEKQIAEGIALRMKRAAERAAALSRVAGESASEKGRAA